MAVFIPGSWIWNLICDTSKIPRTDWDESGLCKSQALNIFAPRKSDVDSAACMAWFFQSNEMKTRIRQDRTILLVISIADDQGSNVQKLLFLSWPLACTNLVLVSIYFNVGHISWWIRTPDSDLISGLYGSEPGFCLGHWSAWIRTWLLFGPVVCTDPNFGFKDLLLLLWNWHQWSLGLAMIHEETNWIDWWKREIKHTLQDFRKAFCKNCFSVTSHPSVGITGLLSRLHIRLLRLQDHQRERPRWFISFSIWGFSPRELVSSMRRSDRASLMNYLLLDRKRLA